MAKCVTCGKPVSETGSVKVGSMKYGAHRWHKACAEGRGFMSLVLEAKKARCRK